MPPKVVNIGDTDENADWIKKLPGHKNEVAIHEKLAEELVEKKPKKAEG